MPDGDAGRGRYLAETDTIPAEVSLHPSDDDPLAVEPRRLRYAQPGGHRSDLGWAWETLHRNGITLLGSPIQVRTWNLSSIWRFATSARKVWLKATPAFCDVEARLLPVLDSGVVPEVFGADSGRVLLADVHGTDQYEANLVTRCGFIGLLVGLQQQWIGRVKELEALALNDCRAAPAIAAIESTIDREVGALDPGDRQIDVVKMRVRQVRIIEDGVRNDGIAHVEDVAHVVDFHRRPSSFAQLSSSCLRRKDLLPARSSRRGRSGP
jgi:hypothetical protein